LNQSWCSATLDQSNGPKEIRVSKQRVLVIGAGEVGLFAAVELLEGGGYDVTVLDRDHAGSGSSG